LKACSPSMSFWQRNNHVTFSFKTQHCIKYLNYYGYTSITHAHCSGVARNFVWWGGGQNTNTISLLFTFFIIFINLDKILWSTHSGGELAITHLAPSWLSNLAIKNTRFFHCFFFNYTYINELRTVLQSEFVDRT